jgi:Flp pilus assembly protein TadG
MMNKPVSNQKGAAAIEMVLVTLFFLVPLLLGTIDLAIAIYNQQVLTNASREGARAGIARSATSGKIVAENYCANRLIPNSASATASESGDGAPQSDYTVTVTYEHQFMFAWVIGINSTILTGRTVMKMETLPAT